MFYFQVDLRTQTDMFFKHHKMIENIVYFNDLVKHKSSETVRIS